VTEITDHLAEIVGRVARAAQLANRPDSVTIVAVSKQQPVDKIAEAFHAGQHHFAESYVQEAIPKMDALRHLDITWHFIGAIQSNKTRLVAERFDWVHTVDREKTAVRLNEQRPYHARPLNVLIQVNQAAEEQKRGALEVQVEPIARAISNLPRLKLRGLMTIPPRSLAPGRAWFVELARLRDRLRVEGLGLDTLSMGMSDDFEAAIAAGSNCVRIGTAIFGRRVGSSHTATP
jgi:pyridoxal phosphate enzyme (YggS family)